MHREHLVVLIGRQNRAIGTGQLSPDQHGLDAADDKEGHRGDAVHDAKLFVVHREQPGFPSFRLHRAAEYTETGIRGHIGRGTR